MLVGRGVGGVAAFVPPPPPPTRVSLKCAQYWGTVPPQPNFGSGHRPDTTETSNSDIDNSATVPYHCNSAVHQCRNSAKTLHLIAQYKSVYKNSAHAVQTTALH